MWASTSEVRISSTPDGSGYSCSGNGEKHCCWIGGVLCPHLEEDTVEGRRWTCSLYRALGSWEAVYASDEYQTTDAAAWFAGGDWPQNIPEALASPSGKCCWQGGD